MKYGLIGEHLPHSFSREIHGRCADYTYELKELTPEEVGPFLERADFSGINVTIPYKKTVIPYLAGLDPVAERIGAVNTVVKRDGRLLGYNTDFFGLLSLVRRLGVSLAGKKALILGSGGTASTARAVLLHEGASPILSVSRHPGKDTVGYSEALTEHADAAFIINTTPVGMYPYADGRDGEAGVPIDLACFPSLLGVVDAVYNPIRTSLVLYARERGIPAEGGLYMLVSQAVIASRIFLGEEPRDILEDPEATRLTERIFREIQREKENIVLIGMPSSGKSTVGAILSSLLGRPLFDTDAEIVRRTGTDIPTLISEEGEAAFRSIESEAVKDLAGNERGAVIATGGGAILRDDNLRALRRTGRLYFLDRPLDLLLPTEDRPLASTREAIEARYHERYARYTSTADVRVPNEGTAEEAALFIRKDFSE